MISFLKWLILVPLALVAVAFAVANRQGVTVSFDPFSSDMPAFALSGPLFIVIILTVVVGVLLGGIAAWLGQGRYRRQARVTKREADELRAEVSRLKMELDVASRQNDRSAYIPLSGQTAA